MSDEHPTAPLPQPEARWVLSSDAPAAPGPKKRRWGWIVAIVVVVALAVGAWFAGEAIARGIVERTIREQITTQLGVSADQQIDIDIPGAILPQLIAGQFADVEISSQDVTVDGITADITASAQDVNLNGGDWSGGYVRAELDEAQLRTLLERVDGFPVTTVSLDAPDVTADFELQVFTATIPVGVSLTPSAVGGDIVLTPSNLRVAGAEISAEALRSQFGAISSTVLRDWDVCIADRLPRAVELTGIEVRREKVVADFEIDSSIMSDPAALEHGTCA